MKKISIIVLFAVLLIGCQENSSILEPEFENVTHNLEKESVTDLNDYKFVHSKNFFINGKTGGVLFIRHQWLNENSEHMELHAKLRIPPGAFVGEMEFDLNFDLENYIIDLYPSPYEFEKPLELTLSFKGVEFPIDDTKYIFTYLDGKEEIESDNSFYNHEDKILKVINAKLHHFSRYGWGRIAR